MSFWGAYISWRQAKKAKASAEIVKNAITNVAEKKETVALTNVLNNIRQFEHFNIRYVTGPQNGKNREIFIERLQFLLSDLNQEKSKINSSADKKERIDLIYNSLLEISNSNFNEDTYKKCLTLIRDLISIINSSIENSIYAVTSV